MNRIHRKKDVFFSCAVVAFLRPIKDHHNVLRLGCQWNFNDPGQPVKVNINAIPVSMDVHFFWGVDDLYVRPHNNYHYFYYFIASTQHCKHIHISKSMKLLLKRLKTQNLIGL